MNKKTKMRFLGRLQYVESRNTWTAGYKIYFGDPNNKYLYWGEADSEWVDVPSIEAGKKWVREHAKLISGKKDVRGDGWRGKDNYYQIDVFYYIENHKVETERENQHG